MTREEIITKVQNLINQAYKYDIDSEYYEGLFDEIENKGLPNWSGKDSEDYISTQQELVYLRNEQKRLMKRGD